MAAPYCRLATWPYGTVAPAAPLDATGGSQARTPGGVSPEDAGKCPRQMSVPGDTFRPTSPPGYPGMPDAGGEIPARAAILAGNRRRARGGGLSAGEDAPFRACPGGGPPGRRILAGHGPGAHPGQHGVISHSFALFRRHLLRVEDGEVELDLPPEPVGFINSRITGGVPRAGRPRGGSPWPRHPAICA